MKIDFHTHTKLAKKLPFSPLYTNWLFEEAKKSGLDAICITEHFNTLGFSEVYQYIIDNYQKKGDFYLAPSGLILIPGMEIDILEGGHTIVLGTIESMISLNKILEPYKDKSNFLCFDELVKIIQPHKVLFGAAHPYRGGSNIPNLSISQLRQFDFIDLNGKDTAINKEKNKKKILELSKRLDKPVLCGSDTHQSFQYGSLYSEFFIDIFSFDELISQIKMQKYINVVDKDIYNKVKSAATLKKALKEIYNLGGDYVNVLISSKIDNEI